MKNRLFPSERMAGLEPSDLGEDGGRLAVTRVARGTMRVSAWADGPRIDKCLTFCEDVSKELECHLAKLGLAFTFETVHLVHICMFC